MPRFSTLQHSANVDPEPLSTSPIDFFTHSIGRRSKIKNAKLKITEMQDPTAGFQEAEACFQKAIAVARKQKAKSLELRAVMSFVHLRQQQAQNHATRNTKHAPDSTKLTRC
jgi:hypothetical protein